MKKVLLLCLSLVMMLSLAACSGDKVEASKNIEGSLEEIMTQIYSGTGLEFPMFANTPLNDENQSYFLGTNDINFEEALASEPMISSIAHSLVLIRLEDGADAQAIKDSILTHVDGFKWICVGVEKENIQVVQVGDLLALVMDNENHQALVDSFKALAK